MTGQIVTAHLKENGQHMAWVEQLTYLLCVPEGWNVPAILREGKAWTSISHMPHS